jgi:hypothetical protein
MMIPSTNEEDLMAQITLDVPMHSFYRLQNALEAEMHKWEIIRLQALSGERPEASPEGAQILIDDTRFILDQLKVWKEEV